MLNICQTLYPENKKEILFLSKEVRKKILNIFISNWKTIVGKTGRLIVNYCFTNIGIGKTCKVISLLKLISVADV